MAISEILVNGERTQLDYNGLANKPDPIVIDQSPTSGSENLVTSGGVAAALADKLDSSLKGQSSGLAELDASGKVPASQLPEFESSENSDWSQLDPTKPDYIRNKPFGVIGTPISLVNKVTVTIEDISITTEVGASAYAPTATTYYIGPWYGSAVIINDAQISLSRSDWYKVTLTNRSTGQTVSEICECPSSKRSFGYYTRFSTSASFPYSCKSSAELYYVKLKQITCYIAYVDSIVSNFPKGIILFADPGTYEVTIEKLDNTQIIKIGNEFIDFPPRAPAFGRYDSIGPHTDLLRNNADFLIYIDETYKRYSYSLLADSILLTRLFSANGIDGTLIEHLEHLQAHISDQNTIYEETVEALNHQITVLERRVTALEDASGIDGMTVSYNKSTGELELDGTAVSFDETSGELDIDGTAVSFDENRGELDI